MVNLENSPVRIFMLFPKHLTFTPRYWQLVLGNTLNGSFHEKPKKKMFDNLSFSVFSKFMSFTFRNNDRDNGEKRDNRTATGNIMLTQH